MREQRRRGFTVDLAAVELVVAGFVLVTLVLAGAPEAHADWTRRHLSPQGEWGQDDKVAAVGAVSADEAVAFGIEKQGQNQATLLYQTHNAGESWSSSTAGDPSNPLGFEIYSDFAFAGETGYAVRFSISGAAVVKTSDSGGTWAPQNIAGLAGDPTALFALDAEHVWVVGTAGSIARTTNGLTWESVAVAGLDADVDLKGVFFIDERVGWAVGGKLEEITEEDFDGNEVVVGYDVLPLGAVVKTTDGGATWQILRSGDDAIYESVSFTTSTRGLMSGSTDGGTFVTTSSDGGASWTEATLPAAPEGLDYYDLTRTICPDPFHCWVFGTAGSREGGMMNRPVFLFSGNAGLNWELQAPDEGIGMVFDADMLDAHRGWACGDFGQIWGFDDGSPVGPGPGPDADAGSTAADAGTTAPGAWAGVLGQFENGQVPPAGGAAQPGADVVGSGHDGSMSIGGGAAVDAGDAGPCSSGDGCSAAPSDTAPSLAWLLLLLASTGLLAARRRWRLSSPMAALAALALISATASCGGGDDTCAPAGPQGGVDIAAPEDLATPEPPAPEDGPYCVNRLDAPPAVLPGGSERTSAGDPRVVVAIEAEGGGGDLWLLEPVTGEKVQLTFFEDPEVHVWDPAWSPDRHQIAFVSDFMANRSPLESNIFVVNLDGTGCRQMSPAPLAGQLAAIDAETGIVEGQLRRPQGAGSFAVVVPVAGAAGAASTGGETVFTNANGGFHMEVPAGDGQIVLRLREGEGDDARLWEAVASYSVAAGESVNLGEVMCDAVGSEAHLAAPTWRPDGSGLVFREETTLTTDDGPRLRVSLFSIDIDGDSMERLAVVDNDELGTPVYDAVRGEILLGLFDGSLSWVAPATLDEAILAVPLQDYDAHARPAVSAHHFVALVVPMDGAREVVVIGADSAGELEVEPVTSFGDDALTWDGVDWAPGGQQLLLTRTSGDGSDIVLLDLLSGATRPLSTDGRCHGAAWFGR